MKFKDALSDLDLWNEWNEFERDYAEQAIRFWLERERLSYDQLAELFNKNQSYPL
jgi:hypothetical protein